MSVFPHELQWLPPRGMAKAVLGWFLSHPQLQVSDQNRLASQCRLIVRSEGVIQKDHRDWRTFVQSLKDVQEYWFIIQALGDRLLQSTFSARLARSLDDSTLPVDSGASTPGRDAQFELLVAAVAARAGLVVDRLSGAGADWIITAQARCWSFEAKRIKNFNMIERRIRKGARQIAASQIGGVIALDISLATNPTCEPLPMFIPDRDIEEAHGERTRALVSEKLGAVEQWIGSANVGFLLLYDSVIRPAQSCGRREEPWGLIGLWSKVNLTSPRSSHGRHYEDLWHLFQAALPNF